MPRTPGWKNDPFLSISSSIPCWPSTSALMLSSMSKTSGFVARFFKAMYCFTWNTSTCINLCHLLQSFRYKKNLYTLGKIDNATLGKLRYFQNLLLFNNYYLLLVNQLPLTGSGRKIKTLVRDHEYFIPTKFHQNTSSGSGEEVENVKLYKRRDDRWCTMTIAHLSLRLWWAKKFQLIRGKGSHLGYPIGKTRGPKGHISCTWVQFATIFVYLSARKIQNW